MRPHITPRHSDQLPPDDAHLATVCLTHQQVEDQATRWGAMCPYCKQAAYVAADLCHDVDHAPARRYWESQPPAYSLRRRPRFVLVRLIGPLKIRSLGWPES